MLMAPLVLLMHYTVVVVLIVVLRPTAGLVCAACDHLRNQPNPSLKSTPRRLRKQTNCVFIVSIWSATSVGTRRVSVSPFNDTSTRSAQSLKGPWSPRSAWTLTGLLCSSCCSSVMAWSTRPCGQSTKKYGFPSTGKQGERLPNRNIHDNIIISPRKTLIQFFYPAIICYDIIMLQQRSPIFQASFKFLYRTKKRNWVSQFLILGYFFY